MQRFLEAFSDELVKVSAPDPLRVNVDLQQAYREAKKNRDAGAGDVIRELKHQRKKNSEGYLLSMALGALAAPVAAVGGRKLTRLLAKRLRPGRKVPGMTIPEVGGHMTRGALTGAVVQMLRDRYSRSSDSTSSNRESSRSAL